MLWYKIQKFDVVFVEELMNGITKRALAESEMPLLFSKNVNFNLS